MAWNSKALDKFCGSPFWNSSLTWYTDDPELTRCFEKTALVLIPISFLFLISPFEIFYLKHSPNRNIPWNWKNSLKIITTTALALICLSDFLSNIGMVKIYKVDIFMPMLKFVSYVYAGVLIYYNKFYGYQASGHQFIFWFLSALCGAPQFRTEIRNVQQNGELENYYFYKSYMIYYPLVVLMFLLNCLADNKPKQYPYGKVQNKCPFDNTSFLGRILWTFVDGILYHGFKRPLEQKDMWNLALENESQNLTPKFEQEFQKRVAKNKEKFMKKQKEGNVKGKPDTVSIIPVIWSCFYRTFLVGASFRMIQDLMAFVNPQILSLVISFVQSDEPQWKGIFYALLMFFVSFTQTLIHHMGFNFLWTFGQRTRVSLMMAIYRKALRISNATRKDKTVGEIVNLMAVDAEKFLEISLQLPMMWAAPTQICFAVYFLWQEVGPAVLAGLALMILLIPVNTVIVRISRKLQLKQMKNKDERVKMMNEILNGIKVLKLYAWEGSFEKIVEMIRIKEVKTLLNMAYLNASSNFIWNCAPFMVSFTVFGTYVLLDPNNLLDPSKTFVSLALLNILRQPMHQIPNVINMAVQAAVSIKRINSFLNSEELNPYVEHKPSEGIDPFYDNT
uniref:ABC transporter C n=1 Tax=Lissorhoptrus oryzophilus TaxID=308863 RepID=A0A2R4FX94_9CUCU|nr:ABC transporter C [Lissorhoptrus oryzophilus]